MNSNRISTQRSDWEAVALALVLIAVGFILMGGDLAGLLSLDRIQNLWPVTVIAIGLADLFIPASSSNAKRIR